MESQGHSKMLWKYKSQNQLCILNLQRVALMRLVSETERLIGHKSILWPLIPQGIPTLDIQIYILLTRNTDMNPENIFRLHNQEMKPLGLNEDSLVLLLFFFFFFKAPIWKLAWGYLHFIMTLSPLKSHPSMRPQLGAWTASFTLSPLLGGGLPLYSNWLKIEDLEAFNNLQQIKKSRDKRAKSLKNWLMERRKLWLY